MDCIFCKIIEGELPSYKVYEDKRVISFLDINPVNKGHLLVVPKEHFNGLLDVKPDILKDLILICQKLAKAMIEATGAKGFNLMVNNGKAAGQLVEHLHFHLIPRQDRDNLHPWPGKAINDEEMHRIAESIKKLSL